MIRREIEAGIGADGKCFVGKYVLESGAWRGVMAQYLRIKEGSDSRLRTNFGPWILDVEGAVEEGFIRRPEDFVHRLTAFSATTNEVGMLGQPVTVVRGLMSVGERSSDGATWLGDMHFEGPAEEPSLVAELNLHRGDRVDLFLPDASVIEDAAEKVPLRGVLAGMRLIRPVPREV